jgi:hypothetical protein
MALFTESGRSKFESTAYTALLLAFFFAVGLAGGVLYRLLPAGSGNDVARPRSCASDLGRADEVRRLRDRARSAAGRGHSACQAGDSARKNCSGTRQAPRSG